MDEVWHGLGAQPNHAPVPLSRVQSSHHTLTTSQRSAGDLLLLRRMPSHLDDRQEDGPRYPRDAITSEGAKSGVQ